ncbi:hypothetical protein AAMO2058_001175300 [Amorphochlora amoebiformis]|uniref:Uncharacterized protein n=1 Tax=Amorphochlora amoebiformis TaxID=1561963 RepID=A0A7S0DGZ5_9EUKA|mmetsp:Transcript_27845/g.44299  ORF Transcript_27845/g.44299 Transcript_27845/m.44299 type:complete len:498 (+) Transcript_27845:140-1633(+)
MVAKSGRTKRAAPPSHGRRRAFKPPRVSAVLPSRVRGVYRLSHREIIDDVADMEHQILTQRNYPVSLSFRKRLEDKGISLEDEMEALRCPDRAKQMPKPSDLENAHVHLIALRAEAAKIDRQIKGHQAEQKALNKQLEDLRKAYTESVRNSESNRVKYQTSVLSLREQLWRETSRTAETSGKLEELRAIKTDLDTCETHMHRYEVQMDSAQMQVDLLKEIADKSTRGVGVKDYPLLVEQFANRQQSQFDALKRELKTSQNETGFVGVELKQATQTRDSLQLTIETKTKQHNELTTTEKMASKALAELQSSMDDLKKAHQELVEKQKVQWVVIEEGRHNIKSFDHTLNIAQRRVLESQAALKLAARSLLPIKKEVLDLQKKCSKVWKETMETHQQCQMMGMRVSELKVKNDGFLNRSNKRLTNAIRSKKSLEQEIHTLETRLDTLNGRFGRLTREFQGGLKACEATTSDLNNKKSSLVQQIAFNSDALLEIVGTHLKH